MEMMRTERSYYNTNLNADPPWGDPAATNAHDVDPTAITIARTLPLHLCLERSRFHDVNRSFDSRTLATAACRRRTTARKRRAAENTTSPVKTAFAIAMGRSNVSDSMRHRRPVSTSTSAMEVGVHDENQPFQQ
jgi:hypothetical protein